MAPPALVSGTGSEDGLCGCSSSATCFPKLLSPPVEAPAEAEFWNRAVSLQEPPEHPVTLTGKAGFRAFRASGAVLGAVRPSPVGPTPTLRAGCGPLTVALHQDLTRTARAPVCRAPAQPARLLPPPRPAPGLCSSHSACCWLNVLGGVPPAQPLLSAWHTFPPLAPWAGRPFRRQPRKRSSL